MKSNVTVQDFHFFRFRHGGFSLGSKKASKSDKAINRAPSKKATVILLERFADKCRGKTKKEIEVLSESFWDYLSKPVCKIYEMGFIMGKEGSSEKINQRHGEFVNGQIVLEDAGMIKDNQILTPKQFFGKKRKKIRHKVKEEMAASKANATSLGGKSQKKK